ncbi:catechol 2,3-dioxygenase-like lactoylglutathione lyase family enzyme [Sphingomonas leidyi]|jgi:catechol 2,3-dioxygenase-like lactoylglutathione lyase family enzyme|uniref:Catechol 2,3-dioxygenase-like lactoylglutathione lyase family enzyme n=1 Tax=Sphingomonas leidyi TaxID=68569 RepID=A0A7X5UZD5_9SPHN|nr:VOC family protein [Sphingomonas leidyi]NIJ64988.1 catechol 2,3-dioxygenase-like lactoylglutathione lyase family enzyme [Sphingomonas leidyi]
MESLLIGPVGQISRRVGDIAAARHWYGDVLGLEHLYSFGDIAFFDCGGVRLFLTQEGDGAEGESVIYFTVSDIRLAHCALESAGIEFSAAPHLIHRHQDGTEEWMAFFKDNEDRTLAILARVAGEPAS